MYIGLNAPKFETTTHLLTRVKSKDASASKNSLKVGHKRLGEILFSNSRTEGDCWIRFLEIFTSEAQEQIREEVSLSLHLPSPSHRPGNRPRPPACLSPPPSLWSQCSLPGPSIHVTKPVKEASLQGSDKSAAEDSPVATGDDGQITSS